MFGYFVYSVIYKSMLLYTCKEVLHMSKKKKKGKHKPLEKIVLATAILNLIYSIIELLKELLN